MPSLASMKEYVDPGDFPQTPLRRVEPPAKAPPTSKPLPGSPGILKRPDGKLETALPAPPASWAGKAVTAVAQGCP